MVDTHSRSADDSPLVIGILCVDIAYKLRENYGDQFTSYLPASYVKFIEGGGGKVIPIWIGQSRGYYEKMLKLLNGVLLPGGAVFFHEHNGYADAGRHIYDIALNMNKEGAYFPIFGICLGFELLLCSSTPTNGVDLRQDCHSVNVSLALNFQESAKDSRLFGSAPDEIFKTFGSEEITFNYHKYCITETDLQEHKIDKDWTILSTNSDAKVKNYISSIEHNRYPFYGVQFHPERNEYESKSKYVHTPNAIKCSRYLADFFVNEARKNQNSIPKSEINQYLISNFPKTSTRAEGIAWEECYLFEQNANYPSEN